MPRFRDGGNAGIKENWHQGFVWLGGQWEPGLQLNGELTTGGGSRWGHHGCRFAFAKEPENGLISVTVRARADRAIQAEFVEPSRWGSVRISIQAGRTLLKDDAGAD